MKHSRSGPVAVFAAEPADPPLDPHQRNAEQQKSNEVRDHEGAAAVLSALNREPEEITETDGVARHRKDQTNTSCPLLALGMMRLRPRHLTPHGISSLVYFFFGVSSESDFCCNAFLNSRITSPRDLPNSGSFLPPNRRRITTKMIRSSRGPGMFMSIP